MIWLLKTFSCLKQFCVHLHVDLQTMFKQVFDFHTELNVDYQMLQLLVY